jgi:RimJ/RimL family protein N-acetyltransferase
MNLQPTLSNKLITLKPLQEDDFNALFEVASDKLLWEQHPNNNRYKKEVFKDFFDIAIQSKSAFVVIDNKTNKIIGSSRYYEFNKEDSSIIIGYTFISREYWGTVYNRNLKDLMTNYAFQFVNIIHFHVGETNYRSQKAVEKLGAIRIGALPDDTSPKTNWLYELKK